MKLYTCHIYIYIYCFIYKYRERDVYEEHPSPDQVELVLVHAELPGGVLARNRLLRYYYYYYYYYYCYYYYYYYYFYYYFYYYVVLLLLNRCLLRLLCVIFVFVEGSWLNVVVGLQVFMVWMFPICVYDIRYVYLYIYIYIYTHIYTYTHIIFICCHQGASRSPRRASAPPRWRPGARWPGPE